MNHRIIGNLTNPVPFFVFLLALLVFSIQCDRRGPHQKISPVAQNGTKKEGTKTGAGGAGKEIKYSDVQAIFKNRCGRCHNGAGLPNWNDEKVAEDFAKNRKLIQRIADKGGMPPAGTAEATEITAAERDLIQQWASSVSKPKESATSSPDSGSAAGQPPGADGTGNSGGGTPDPVTEVTVASPAPAAPQSLASTLQQCAACHGEHGLSSSSGFPHLAGQSASYLNEQLNHFREGIRKDSSGAMNGIASNLSKENQDAVVSYFSNRPPPAATPLSGKKIENFDVLFKKGQELVKNLACTGCHDSGPNLLTVAPHFPNLAGQDPVYIQKQLSAFLSGERTNASVMPNLLKQANPPLTDEDLQALGIYFQNLRPEKTESKD
ncbi:MAG: c-type cytochrome [Bdellovibrionales bacterium]|nr:c-type cytochrome [Bdellovibrionales bacterium]